MRSMVWSSDVCSSDLGPGESLRGQHLHYGDAINLIVTGSVCMDGTWLRPGHAKIAPAGLTYGDAIPAPEGYTFLEIFESHPGAKPCYSNPRHQRYFEEVHGEEIGRASCRERECQYV